MQNEIRAIFIIEFERDDKVDRAAAIFQQVVPVRRLISAWLK